MSVQDCVVEKDGVQRAGKSWGADGYCYLCSVNADGEVVDCSSATAKAEAAGAKAVTEDAASTGFVSVAQAHNDRYGLNE